MARREKALAWPVTLDPAEEGGFVVNFPDFPEGWSQGDSREEALAQAADLLETMVANYMAEGWDLPDPSRSAGKPLVHLAPLVAAKAELYRTMRDDGRGITGLLRRLGRITHRPMTQRVTAAAAFWQDWQPA